MTFSPIAQTPIEDYRDQKESGKDDSTKGIQQLYITNPKEMEIQKLLDKKFKIIILKKIRKLQEHTDKQFHNIRKTIQEQNEECNDGTEEFNREI